MYDAIYIERTGKPTTTFVFEHFLNDAMSAASSKGMPVVRVVPETIVSESTVVADIEKAVTAVFDDIVDTLTRPLTTEEKSPRPREPESYPRIIFKGNLQDVNQFFYQRGWTDGLPIILPTEERVVEMLTGTDHDPQEVIGHMSVTPHEEKLEYTVEKVAVNAVMTGARPEHFPVILALGASGRPSMPSSTTSFASMMVVNGPVRNEIGMNSGLGDLSPVNY